MGVWPRGLPDRLLELGVLHPPPPSLDFPGVGGPWECPSDPVRGCPLQERSQQPLPTEGPHLSVPASVIVSAPPPAQDPAPAGAQGAGLGPQAPDSHASPVPTPQVDRRSSLCQFRRSLAPLLPARRRFPAQPCLPLSRWLGNRCRPCPPAPCAPSVSRRRGGAPCLGSRKGG